MSFQVRYNSNNRIVRVCHFGRMALADTLAAAEQVFGNYSHLQPLRVLVDVRKVTNVMTGAEQKRFGRFLAEHPVAEYTRAAVLHNRAFNARAVIDSEAAARGFCLAQFILEAEAISWLRGEKR